MRSEGLNDRQALFAQEYLVDRNATQAAIRAGYSAKTAYSQGERLLRHVEVKRAIAGAVADRNERVKVDADWVLAEAVGLYTLARNKAKKSGAPMFGAAKGLLDTIGKHIDVQAFKDRVEHDVTADLAAAIAAGNARVLGVKS